MYGDMLEAAEVGERASDAMRADYDVLEVVRLEERLDRTADYVVACADEAFHVDAVDASLEYKYT